MGAIGGQPTGESILKTLIELLEAQEQIKITYKIGEGGDQMKLYPHQTEALTVTKDYKRCAYYHDMGLGKTYTGSEKMRSLPHY